MKTKIKIDLGPVQKTLFLPVWARAMESQKSKPLLIDNTAVKIMEIIDYDFTKIMETISEIVQISWIARCKRFDDIINNFIKRHPYGTIVNIGCGMDTTYERLNNGSIRWYDLDLPDVINLRQIFIEENSKREFISSSFLDPSWFEKIKINDSALFISANVFWYIKENLMEEFFKNIANTFNNLEMLFDVASPIGVKFGNELLEKTGMNSSPHWQWGLKDKSVLESWDNKIKILNTYQTFNIKGLNLSFKNRIIGFLSNLSKNNYMIHLQISS